MVPDIETGHQVGWIGDQVRTFGDFRHADAVRVGLCPESVFQCRGNLRVAYQRHAGGSGRGGTGDIVRCGADTTVAEYDISAFHGFVKDGRQAWEIVMLDAYPVDFQPAFSGDPHRIGKVCIPAFAREQFVTDKDQSDVLAHPRHYRQEAVWVRDASVPIMGRAAASITPCG